MRYPDGSFHPIGEGTIPAGADTDGYQNGFVDDPNADIDWIAPGGAHRIFESNVALLLGVPDGVVQVYDRTPAGLELVSLLPGEVPSTAASLFAGAAADGSTVLFVNEENLYARIDNAKTVPIASIADGPIVPGGVNADGSRAFFAQGGDISYYDVEAEEVKEVVATGEAVIAYISPDGSHVFFVSEEELITGKGSPGAPNLYVWDSTGFEFIATVTAEDLVNSENEGSPPFAGLELWAEEQPGQRAVAQNQNFLTDTARTTFGGTVFVFESRAQLTDYPNEGHVEIYRYDSGSGDLDCVSCSPYKTPAAADSNLVVLRNEGPLLALSPMHEIVNLSAGGTQIVFESKDDLLAADVNGVRDVYRWRDGDLALISTGHGAQPSGVVGVSSSGDDIFFQTTERLVAQGQDPGAYAIYDARVAGGLASQQASPAAACEGEGCLGMPSAPPGLVAPGSSQFRGRGNVKARCRKSHRKNRGGRGSHTTRHHKKKKACRAKGRRMGR